jgi:hypothetical protein
MVKLLSSKNVGASLLAARDWQSETVLHSVLRLDYSKASEISNRHRREYQSLTSSRLLR